MANAKSFLIDVVLESKPGKIASSFCNFFLNRVNKNEEEIDSFKIFHLV